MAQQQVVEQQVVEQQSIKPCLTHVVEPKNKSLNEAKRIVTIAFSYDKPVMDDEGNEVVNLTYGASVYRNIHNLEESQCEDYEVVQKPQKKDSYNRKELNKTAHARFAKKPAKFTMPLKNIACENGTVDRRKVIKAIRRAMITMSTHTKTIIN